MIYTRHNSPPKRHFLPKEPLNWAGLPGAARAVEPYLLVTVPPVLGGSSVVGCKNLVSHCLKSELSKQ